MSRIILGDPGIVGIIEDVTSQYCHKTPFLAKKTLPLSTDMQKVRFCKKLVVNLVLATAKSPFFKGLFLCPNSGLSPPYKIVCFLASLLSYICVTRKDIKSLKRPLSAQKHDKILEN